MLTLLYSLKTTFTLQMFTQCRHFSAIIFAFCSVCYSKWAELANRSRKFSTRFGSRFLRKLPFIAARRNKSVRRVTGFWHIPLYLHCFLSQLLSVLCCHLALLRLTRGALDRGS